MISDKFRVLRHSAFRRLVLARFFGNIASNAQIVAVGWQVYAATESAWYLGMIGLAGFLPFVAMSLFSGLIIDRFDRRKVLLIAYVIYSFASVLLFLNAWLDSGRVWPVFIIMGIIGMVRAFTLPTQQALTPNAVPRSDLAAAISLGASTNFLAIMIGPALGGVLYGFGAETVYLVTACLASLSIAVLMRLQINAPPLQRQAFSLDNILIGLRFIRHRRSVMGAISLDLFAVLLGGGDGSAADLCPDYFAGGAGGAWAAADGTGLGFDGHGGVARLASLDGGGWPGHAVDGGVFWAGDNRLRTIDEHGLVARRAGRAGRHRYGECLCPADPDSGRHPRRDARPGRGGEFPVHRRLQRTRGV